MKISHLRLHFKNYDWSRVFFMITCLFMSFACLSICFPFRLIHCNTWQIMTLCPVLSTFYLLSIFFVFLCLLSYRSFVFFTYSALLVFLKMLFDLGVCQMLECLCFCVGYELWKYFFLRMYLQEVLFGGLHNKFTLCCVYCLS